MVDVDQERAAAAALFHGLAVPRLRINSSVRGGWGIRSACRAALFFRSRQRIGGSCPARATSSANPRSSFVARVAARAVPSGSAPESGGSTPASEAVGDLINRLDPRLVVGNGRAPTGNPRRISGTERNCWGDLISNVSSAPLIRHSVDRGRGWSWRRARVRRRRGRRWCARA